MPLDDFSKNFKAMKIKIEEMQLLATKIKEVAPMFKGYSNQIQPKVREIVIRTWAAYCGFINFATETLMPLG